MSDFAPTMPPASPAPATVPGRSLARLKQDYLSYLDGKRGEIDEQQEARRYYHGAHWTAKQNKTLNQRKQPIVTYNRLARKINAVVGLLERQLAVAAQAIQGPAESLARLNHSFPQGVALRPEQRTRLEEQYAGAAKLLLAALQPAPSDLSDQAAGHALGPAVLERFEPEYLLADNNTLGFVLTRLREQPGEPAANYTAIARLRQIVRDVQAQHRYAWIGLTGMPVIEHDEMAASQFDMVGRNWTGRPWRALVDWAVRSGNWWVLFLLPFLVVLATLDTDEQGRYPAGIYTLF